MKRPASLLIRFTISALRITCLLALILGLPGPVDVGHAAAPVAQDSLCPADSICVNTLLDDKKSNDGLCSLREAIVAANSDKASGGKSGECAAGSGADTIHLAAPPDPATGTARYTLSRTDNGNEDASQTGDLDVASDLTIVVDGPGATIDASGITDRVFHILGGKVSISGVAITGGGDNVSQGAGIFNAGNLALANVTVSGNKAMAVAGGGGGGIYNTGDLTLNNVTIADNVASFYGGGVVNDGGTVTLQNTIIAANTASSLYDCKGTLSSLGYNLVEYVAEGCTIDGGPTDKIGRDARLGPLQNNGGETETHALLAGSPAIEAGDNNTCLPTDQRGVSRPRGLACDMGAYELENPPPTGPVTVNTGDDTDDGVCSFEHCSLREAINAANARPNDGDTPDEIHFNIPTPAGSPPTIEPGSALPTITDPVVIDGTTQPVSGEVVLDGSNAGAGADGLTITAGNSTIRGLVITNFNGHGILLDEGDNNTIAGNTIAYNGGDGIRILFGSTGNAILGNDIHDNGGLAIDLGGDGPTPNDEDDPDTGANFVQNFPILFRAVPEVGTRIEGWLNSTADSNFSLEFFAAETCGPTGPGSQIYLGATSVTTDNSGDVYFKTTVNSAVPVHHFVVATATDADGNTSEFSPCLLVGLDNDAWPKAYPLPLGGDPPSASIEQRIGQLGQSRWYKFSIEPNSRVIVTLTNLPANYDLTVYKDIQAAFAALQAPQDPQTQDLLRLGAEFAPDSFSPDSFSPDSFSPDSFSPDSFSPDSFSPDSFSPDSFSPDSFSPDSFSPDSFSPDSFSPDSFSPDSFSPDSFSPDSFSPDSFSPDSFSPDSFSPDSFSPDSFSPDSFSPDSFSPDSFSPDSFSPDSFSGAQTRSLLGVSAFDGTAGEGISLNTWNNTGDFYVRVRGRNGAFNPDAAFHLEVKRIPGECGGVPPLPNTDPLAPVGNPKTLILVDSSRMEDRIQGTDEEKEALLANLDALALRPEVNGLVVDVSQDTRVNDANGAADARPACPYAKNLAAQAIKDIVDGYHTPSNSNLEYLVIVGGDEIIPYFRYPDNALLAPESQYYPPVLDSSPSQASLRLDYVLSQDAYGSRFDVSLNNSTYPVPELAVGRLVETAAEMNVVLVAFLNGTIGGVVPEPTSALVTGYDFLADAAYTVRDQLVGGLAGTAVVDELIDDRSVAPQDGWTAGELRQKFLDTDQLDLAFLAGHFSASSALAADYATRLETADLIASSVDLENAIIFSPGCHSGYNIVNQHDVPNVTREPDWAQAFALKGATLIAGTGYQYGDTDFLEYSERIYLEFSKQLRVGSGPVSIGRALVEAKKAYLTQTPIVRGLHEKALLEATIFGLPMLSVDLPGRLPAQGYPRINPVLSSFDANPGATLGLRYADVPVTSPLDEHPVTLKNVADNSDVPAEYLSGTDGAVVTNPAEPALPLEVRNVTVEDSVLRGVGFRGGSYREKDVVPVTGAPTTELRGVHIPFLTDYFYPIQLARGNYYDALVGGETLLMVTPAQHKISVNLTDPQQSTRRQFEEMNFRLYYSSNFETYAGNPVPSTPALAAAPAIIRVSATPDGGFVTFNALVAGNPAAGVQEVWVTYTDTGLSCPAGGGVSCTWQSLNLVQNPSQSTLWTGQLDLAGITDPANIRYMIQSANGVGVVSRVDNMGRFFIPGVDAEPTQETSLEFLSAPIDGRFGTKATFSAKLTRTDLNPPEPLAGQLVIFRVGPVSRQVATDASGVAQAELALLALPGAYQVQAFFAGTADYMADLATSDFTILKQDTQFCFPETDCVLQTTVLPNAEDTGIMATLTDVTGRALRERSVFFVVSNDSSSYSAHEITDLFGRAHLGPVPLGSGVYAVSVYFSGTRTLKTETGDISVTLDDASYNPSEETEGSLTINSPPVADDQAVVTDEDTPVAITLTASDVDGDPLSFVVMDPPISGTLSGDAPNLTYTPNTDFSGTDSFTFRANDGTHESNLATVTITVNPVNDPPVAMDDAYSTDEDAPLTVPAPGVLENDQDVDGDALTAILTSDPVSGTLTFNAEGSFSYTPNANFNGTDTFTYRANDGTTDSNLATVTITVNSVNDPPGCSEATSEPGYIWPPDKEFWPVTVQGVTDPDADPLTITVTGIFQDELVGSRPDGEGVGTDTAMVRADRDGNGDGRVYHIFFTADDGQGGTCEGEVRTAIVSHDQSGDLDLDAIDGGALYDSTQPE